MTIIGHLVRSLNLIFPYEGFKGQKGKYTNQQLKIMKIQMFKEISQFS